MRILFLGDIVGRCGRDAVLQHLPALRTTLAPDVIIINGENAAGGFGLTEKIANGFFEAGVDCITTGNHVWDQKELVATIDRLPRVLRPMNYPEGTPGRGAVVLTTADGRRVLVACVVARLFMDPADDPFAAAERLVRQHPLGGAVAATVFDIHGEATSEKMAFGHFLSGRVSLVAGTHSHIPTADAMILKGGTAYITDAGMCGDYDSVIGMKKEASIQRFVRRLPGERLAPAEGDATVCGVFVTTDDRTGLATHIAPVRIGGRLQPTPPAPGSEGV